MLAVTPAWPHRLPARWRAPFERSFGKGFAHVRVLSGPAVDADLAARHALARALDPGRIALASGLDALPEAVQFFVVGHELAHTVQLERGGCTPVQELEAEANRAAACGLRGVPCPIRGGSNRPLNAEFRVGNAYEACYEQAPIEVRTNSLAIVNKDWDAAAKTYYDTFRYEPSGGILTGKTPGPGKGRAALRWLTVYTEAKEFSSINLLDVLDWIIKYGLVPNGGVVLVCHGDTLGLTLPLVKGGVPLSIGSTNPTSVIDYLTHRHKNYSDEAAAYGMHLTELNPKPAAMKKAAAHLKALREKIDGVRKKELRHIAFRACQAGKNPEVLAGLKDLFGAARASAPKLRTFFGHFKVLETSQDDWAKIQGADSKWQCYVAPPQVGVTPNIPKRFAIRINGADPNAGNTCVADSADAVNWFIDNYLPPSNKFRFKSGKLYYQGFWDPAEKRLIFPQEEAYVKNLQYDTSALKRPFPKLAT